MTPKTLDKYIAALKKKAAAESWTQDHYQAELDKIKNEMAQQYLDNKITTAEYTKVSKQLDNATKNPGLLGKAPPAAPAAQTASAPAGMSHSEYIGMWEALNKKKKAGLITQDEYYALGGKLDKAYHEHKTVSEIDKEIGCDPGTLATDEAVIRLGKEFKKIYGQAAQEMKTKLDGFLKQYGPEIDALNQKLADGTITQAEHDRLENLLLQQKVLGQKADQLAGVMTNANKKALASVNHEMLGVFADNAAWQSYQLEKDAKMDLMFSIYDEHTAERLIREKPELLKSHKELDAKKDKAWNSKMISGAVTQAVLQGESIPKLARRIAAEVGEKNSKAMMRYARTAMTAAQNGGRIEMLHRAESLGIKVKKRWLATLDSRTRDSHQHMDGVSVGVDEDFVTPLGSKMQFPGDPAGKGGDVWNCRCTLVYDYEGFPNDAEYDRRRDNESGELIANMDYTTWKAAKEGSVLNDLSNAKVELAAAQKEFVAKKVNPAKVYSDIWKDPVTLADYPEKAGKIQAKRDYFTSEIQKYKDAQAAGYSWATDDKIKDLQKKLRNLNEFEKHGQILQNRDAALKKVQEIYNQAGIASVATAPDVAKKAKKAAQKKAAVPGDTGMSMSTSGEKRTPFAPDAYSQERKDKALWTTDRSKVDSMMRGRTGEVWRNASEAERDAIYEYTMSYSKFNEPLRGIEYGTSRYLGVGNTDLNAGSKRNGKRLNAMTDIIDKCSYDHDQWFQRGCGWGGMDKFLQIDERLLRNGTQKELQDALLGKTVTEYGFMSMGSAKGKGFSGNVLFNIYAPAGTKMMYVEPFSAYSGSSVHKGWDGKTKQSSYGGEFETIMQQGTQFRITKVEKSGHQLYIDIEVINQDNQQRWKQ